MNNKKKLHHEKITIELTWAKQKQSKFVCDLDLYCVLLLDNNSIDQTIFYNNQSAQGVLFKKEARAVGINNVSEKIEVTLQQLPTKIQHIIFVVNIFGAMSREQHFGNIVNPTFTLYDGDIKKFELDLSSLPQKTTAIPATIYHSEQGWQLRQANLSSAKHAEYLENFLAKFNRKINIAKKAINFLAYILIISFLCAKISVLSIWQMLLVVICATLFLPMVTHSCALVIVSIGKMAELEGIHSCKVEFINELVRDLVIKNSEYT